MALYAIGDLHLSLGAKKPMDIFPGWENYTEKLLENWKNTVSPEDTVVLCGDTSWGMSLDEALPDFKFIDTLPGKRKLILKGNHDYWWNSASKMTRLFEENQLFTLSVLHNNAFSAEGFAICGARGWIFENGQPHDEKIINREAIRIEISIKASLGFEGERLLFLHYPPVFAGQELEAYIELMRAHGIKRCFYGHIHGAGHRQALIGTYKSIDFMMVSADYLKFRPFLIRKTVF